MHTMQGRCVPCGGLCSEYLESPDQSALANKPMVSLTDRQATFLDEGWKPDGRTLRPSLSCGIRVCVIATARDGGEREARAWLASIVSKARARYRDGFYANPFTAEPVLRPSPTGDAQ